MPYGFDQPSCDIARAFFKVLYRTPPISSASHESGTYRRNANLDKFDAGVGIVVLRSRTHDDDGLAGFDNRKTLSDRCYDGPRAIGRPEGVWSGKWIAAHAPN
jgi:hypothetical protein